MPPHAPATGSSPQPASPHEAGTTTVSIKTLSDKKLLRPAKNIKIFGVGVDPKLFISDPTSKKFRIRIWTLAQFLK
jgi:hypothetical protein